jgi:hypothetical protein
MEIMNEQKYHLFFVVVEWIIYTQLGVSTWVQNSHRVAEI